MFFKYIILSLLFCLFCVTFFHYSLSGILINDLSKLEEKYIKRHKKNKEIKIKFAEEIIKKTSIKERRTFDDSVYNLYAKEIYKVSSKYPSIDFLLLLSLFYQESKFYPLAVSKTGAIGLGQIVSGTRKHICDEWNINNCTDSLFFNPVFNIHAAAWYLNRIYKRSILCNKDIDLSLAYYNGGGRQAFYYKLYRKNGYSNEGKLSNETKNYVLQIKRRTFRWKQKLNKLL